MAYSYTGSMLNDKPMDENYVDRVILFAYRRLYFNPRNTNCVFMTRPNRFTHIHMCFVVL